MTPKEIVKATTYKGYSGNPFSQEELASVPNKIKEVMIAIAEYRFPKNSKLVANVMCGACMVIIDVFKLKLLKEIK